MKTILRAFAGILILSAMTPQNAKAVTYAAGAMTYAFGMVYGNGWGFMYRTPPDWTFATCGAALGGTVITLWPKGQHSNPAETVIYVTVAPRGKTDFSDFIRAEIARFKAHDPVSARTVFSHQTVISSTRRLIHVTHSAGNRDELVEYIQGRTAYFIVVLTSVSPAATARYRPAYRAFLDSFTPATLKCSGKVCASTTRALHENCGASVAAK